MKKLKALIALLFFISLLTVGLQKTSAFCDDSLRFAHPDDDPVSCAAGGGGTGVALSPGDIGCMITGEECGISP
ncbi:MAG: hypothetical protein ACLFRI_07905 [Candidatus Izemoplasmataceae bacterium]